jgi:hypothetical protein
MELEETARSAAGTSVEGHLARRLSWAPFRVLAVVTGFALLRGLLALVARYALMLRRRARATVADGTIALEVEWSIMGRGFRRTRTVAPIASIDAARFENRRRYVHLLIGFGFLAAGTWVGIQYLVDGLRAGFPFLALVGAGIVLAGIAVDLLLYAVVPEGKGRARIVLAMGPWLMRIAGVPGEDGERFIESVRGAWRGSARGR